MFSPDEPPRFWRTKAPPNLQQATHIFSSARSPSCVKLTGSKYNDDIELARMKRG